MSIDGRLSSVFDRYHIRVAAICRPVDVACSAAARVDFAALREPRRSFGRSTSPALP
ncbi:MAG: hypothetical protein R3A79_21830 [Nannocystaceae bacterium]